MIIITGVHGSPQINRTRHLDIIFKVGIWKDLHYIASKAKNAKNQLFF